MDPLKASIEKQLINPIDEKTKELLMSYDFRKLSVENVAALESNFTREELTNTVQYIAAKYTETHPVIIQRIKKNDQRNKKAYAVSIKIFLNGILPLECNVCNDEYCHTEATNADDNKVSCTICNRFSHKQCLVEGDLKPGTFHLCSLCISDLNQRKSGQNKEASDSGKDQLDISRISRLSSVGDDSGMTSEEDKKSKDEKALEAAKRESEAGICALYAEGKCPHGLRGRNCEFEHPKKCRYYCAYGNEYPQGCRRGRKCWFFHPKLCQNSAKMQACLNKKCTLVHLKDTTRDPTKREPRKWNSEEQNSDSYDRRRTERGYSRKNNPDPWTQDNDKIQIETKRKSENIDRDFLVKLLESMRAEIKSEQTQQNQQMQTQFAHQIHMGIQQAFHGIQQVPNLAPVKMPPQVANLVPPNIPQQMFNR